MNSKRNGEALEKGYATHEEVWLLGQPPLQELLDFVRNKVSDSGDSSPARLTDEWRRASEYYQQLEDQESGIADQAELRELDPQLAPLAAEVLADPHCRETYDTVPVTIGVVELDRLIAFQKSVTWTYVDQAKSSLAGALDPESVFRFCMPIGERATPVRIRRGGSRHFQFKSDSMDMRYHGTRIFAPDQIRDHDAFGPVAGIVGVVVGFGSNLLNVIRSGPRMLLHDGYHRACALRELGVTHAPAIIQTVTCADELDVVARSAIARDSDYYFRSARPPLLKDFFDPKIRRVLRTPKMSRVVEVSYKVREFTVLE